jgi:tRNA (cytidine/uridine-2'-O-)-methyltransferase
VNVVLFEPQIPQNTGNIGRLCAGTGTHLHLVGTLGFSLEDRYLKRAGLDYWPHLTLSVHDTLDDVIGAVPREALAFYSTHAKIPYDRFDCLGNESYFIFGRETTGLPPDVHERYADRFFTIPCLDKIRSLNLANSAAVVLYDALRKCDFDFGGE